MHYVVEVSRVNFKYYGKKRCTLDSYMPALPNKPTAKMIRAVTLSKGSYLRSIMKLCYRKKMVVILDAGYNRASLGFVNVEDWTGSARIESSMRTHLTGKIRSSKYRDAARISWHIIDNDVEESEQQFLRLAGFKRKHKKGAQK